MTFYLIDGSEECFFTAVFIAYKDKEAMITSESDIQIGFDSCIKNVTYDKEKAERVKRKIREYDKQVIEDVNLILRSNNHLKEQKAFDYVKVLMQHKMPVRDMLANPIVMEAMDICKRVTFEIHRIKGFLRFMENAQGVLYAPFSPDNDILDLLAPHFAERLKNQKFVIHDVKRKYAALYDKHELLIVPAGDADVCLSEYEKAFESLWKQYYNSVNITARPHEKQMKGYMPVRYWKFLPEKNGNDNFE